MVKLAAALFFLFPLLPVVAVPIRWAILGDSGPQARKTADLLLAGLSGNSQMVFVERDSLTEVTEEAELNALLDAAGSSRRARLLGLIKADRLVVLSTRSANAQPTLQVVIAESAQGARLAAIEFPIDPEQELVGRIIQLIQATNQHYADGIKAVVGVAPLTPENLEQGDDSLSTTYRDLLQGELSLLPGVAVIEMDEARAIAGEVSISGGDVGSRTTPVLIDGSYKTVRNDGNVTLNLKITQGANVLASIHEVLPRKEVATFFRKEISSRALRNQVQTGKVSVDAQFHWLVTQAEGFSKLGLHSRAAGLREAALLLKPDEARERVSLIAEYREIYGNVKAYMNTTANSPRRPTAIDEEIASFVSAYETALEHLEYLIMNRQVNREIAADLIVKNGAMQLISSVPYRIQDNGSGKPPVRVGAEILLRAEDAEFAMHQMVMPVYFTLPVPPNNKWGLGMGNFDNAVMNSYLKRIDSTEKTSKQLDECLYYFNELFPDDNWMSYGMATFIGTDRRDWAGLAVIGDARWLSFLDQLSQSKKPRVRLLAEYGKIRFEVMVGKELNASEKTALFARAKKWWLATGQPLHWHNREVFSEPVFEDMRGILNRLEPPAEKETSMLPPDPVKPANWQTDPSSWEYWGCPYMLGHLRFKELPVQTANPLPAKLAFTKGDNQADYLWNESGIWLLDARLKVSPIAADAAVPIRDVKWDGEYLWVLSGLNKGKSDCSLAIYDRQGRRVAGVNTAGFSAHDRSMRMAMMRKGVACVAGTFQPYNRTWLALATLSGGKIEIKEFHHAKELPTAQQNSMDFGNTNMAFVPIWMQVMCLEPGEPDYLLIGRHYATTGEDWHPLMINTITLDVSVHPYWMNGRSGLNQDYLCHNGEMFVPNDWGVSVFPRLSENPPKSRKIDDQVPPRQLGKKGGSFVTQFIHQGSIHIIGYKWIRVDLATLNEEEMTLGYIPRKWQMQWYASSDSHGIIGYNGRLFSISFAEKLLFTQDE